MPVNSYALVIGIGKVGTLPLLHGARNDANRFAAWASANGYVVSSLIDTDQAGIRFDQIRQALDGILENEVERLLVFFSGHGVGLADGDYWLCSDYMNDGDECINQTLSMRTARQHPVSQISFFVDACRSAGAEAQQANGRNLFTAGMPGLSEEPQIDQYFATRPGKVAIEKKNGDPAKAYGVFSNCLFDALIQNEERAFESPGRSEFITSQSLAQWLKDEVPNRSSQIPGAQVQWPSVIPGWWRPEDWYVQRSFSQKPDSSDPNFTNWIAPSGLDSIDGPDLPVMPTMPTPEVSDAEKTDQDEAHRIQQTIRLAQGRQGFETREGFTVVGAEVLRVVARLGPDQPELFRENDAWQIRCRRHCEQLAIELADGRWIGTCSLPEFVGVIIVEDGVVSGQNFKIAHNSDRWHPGLEYEDGPQSEVAARWMALMATGGETDGEELRHSARLMRNAKHANPSFGILAAYAYDQWRGSYQQRESSFDSADSIASYFREQNGFVPFDVALLTSNPAQWDRIAGSFPFMTRGWSLLESWPLPQTEQLRLLRPGLLPGPWTTFRNAEGELLASLIEQEKV